MSRSSFALVVGLTLTSALSAQVFDDDFERADGPVDGWTVHDGDWNVSGGVLVAGPASATEQHAYVGDPALDLPPGDYLLSVDMAFSIDDQQPVGRHAGVAFCMDQPGARTTSSGYLVWWIDRASDRGINLTRRDGGAFNHLVMGAGDFAAQPPTNLIVEVSGDTISVFADEVLVVEHVDTTYRGGHFGLWTWNGAGQHVAFDNFVLEADIPELTACFTFDPATPLPGNDVIFDATCSVATAGDIVSYEWSFGDGSSATSAVVEHVYEFSDNYVVTLTVEDDRGNVASADRTVAVPDTLLPFEDDFDRAEGLVDGWTVFSGDWRINASGQLQVTTTGAEEAHIWAGDPAGVIAGDITIDFDIEFLATPTDGVGRHAGMFFFAAQPISRWQTSAYDVWWIDRTQDFGAQAHYWNGFGGLAVLGPHTGQTLPGLTDPPRHWTVTVDDSTVRYYGDGQLLGSVDDVQGARSGHFGFWAYANGQDVIFDNVLVRSGIFPPAVEEVFPCATASDTTVLVGDPITFDAFCSRIPDGVTVTDYRWDFGDGDTAEGDIVEHAFDEAGFFTVTLTLDHDAGDPVSATLSVTINEVAILPIHDTFDVPAGEVPGWTASSGDWSITEDGQLEVVTSVASGEAHIWLGSPPLFLEGDMTIEFEIEFVNHDPPVDPIGRHAGVFFFSEQPILRWSSNSYDVWWIDRAQDFGMGLHRWSPLALLGGPSFDLLAQPPRKWRVEILGEQIRVFGDDELVTEAFDGARRCGYFGFWAYSNDQRVRFDNVCIVEGPFEGSPECETVDPPEDRFVRGDSNASGTIDLTDGVLTLSFLFTGGDEPACPDAADTDDNGTLVISDAVITFSYLFTGGAAPLPPSPTATNFPVEDCGVDPTDDALRCGEFPRCL